MLCIINCQYTHNQGKFCQNFQFFHMYTSFSVNLHHFTVTKPKFRSKSPKFRSEFTEISFFEFEFTFRSELANFGEISTEISFPANGGIRQKNEKCKPWMGHPFSLLRPRPQHLGRVRVMQHLLRPFPLGHGCRRDREQLSTEQQSVFSTRASQRRRQRMGRSIFVIEIKKRRK